MANTSWWYAPAPSELTTSRLSLDFGLRRADQFYREMVVPGLGRVWFVRQLSWPIAALALHGEFKAEVRAVPPTAICRGIEALACKLAYATGGEESSERILGRRAFRRDEAEGAWSFAQLRQQRHYVRNTHRTAATRAMRVAGGLGLASGTRFDVLALEPVGQMLARAFLDQKVGKGGTTLGRRLKEWIRGEHEVSLASATLVAALSPDHTTAAERAVVRARVLEVAGPACDKRARLAAAIGRAAELPNIEDVVVERLRRAGHTQQADEIGVARSFGAMLDRARDMVARLTMLIEPARGGSAIDALVRDAGLGGALAALREASARFVAKVRNMAGVAEATSLGFADGVVRADNAACVRLVVARAGELLALAGDRVMRGGLFRVLAADDGEAGEDDAASREPDRTGRTFRMANLHSLLRDLEAPEAS
jgi:hypothetical protein